MTKQKEPGKSRTMLHQDFFRLCQLLLSKKDDVLVRRPSYVKLAVELTAEFGRTVTDFHVKRAMEATQVVWTPLRRTGKQAGDGQSSVHRNNVRIITTMLNQLVLELQAVQAGLGVAQIQPSPAFARLYQWVANQKVELNQGEQS